MKGTPAVQWDRRTVLVGIALVLAGVTAIFVPIALLVGTLATALGAGASGSAAPAASNLSLITFAIPAGALVGVVCLGAGGAVIARARRAGRT